MASVDIFGKPIRGNQHSAFYNRLVGNKNKLTAKQKYELEKKKLDQQVKDSIYKNKLKEVQNAQLELRVAQTKNAIRNPPIFEQTKRKIEILKGFFK